MQRPGTGIQFVNWQVCNFGNYQDIFLNTEKPHVECI